MDVSIRRVAVVGTGYVGLTIGACLASFGYHVTCADIDETKVARLREGRVDILEPGLAELVENGIAAGDLEFVVGASAAADAEIVFLCVPTPMGQDGNADLSAIRSVVTELRELLAPGTIVVTKSTVPVGTAEWVSQLLGRQDLAVVSNPEFLAEGSAVHDFLNPDRIVVGSDDENAAHQVACLYGPLRTPTVCTDAASAEMIKYASNCFLAVKLSYVNAMAELCESVGADIDAVTAGMGHDPRIGSSFLRPGPGWGGSCLPKDTSALLRSVDATGGRFDVLRAAIEDNNRQRERVVERLRAQLDRPLRQARIGVLGLAFKSGTNDLRGSPALAVTELLLAEGAEITAFDPAIGGEVEGITIVDDAYQAVKATDAVLLLTEWPMFRTLRWDVVAELMSGSLVLDTRNHLDPATLNEAGLTWHGVGRPAKPK
ncbi:UDP-glucose dehydrogenase family protein [Sciscionella marina]|uniref:UDP-glucose dehydrogenase family protein n=1 Tax=Sciscionella marina TaxID=508770 RepID=UPI000374E86E|nr:UDP-glucose/GDP-mannose dehydrogenase family protein [Sciscionella marina]